jgi:integrase/recombinase XerD
MHLPTTNDLLTAERCTLSPREFQSLATVPLELQWLANIDSPQTRRAYRRDIQSFVQFCGLNGTAEFDSIRRPHVMAWRSDMQRQALSGSTIRRRMSALASLFDFLCDSNLTNHNPVRGVKRPKTECNQGKTPALSTIQARALLDAPDSSTLKGVRDSAIVAVLLHHGLRREELCALRVKDFGQQRRGIAHMVVHGKGGKIRYIPVHPESEILVGKYLQMSGHLKDANAPLFRSVSTAQKATLARKLTPGSIYSNVVRPYMAQIGIHGELMGPHVLRCTATTTALENYADIASVQEWLGHANITTTRLYDRRQLKATESPTYKITY